MQVTLLGKPGLQFEAEKQAMVKGRTGAFLYYLAYQSDWVSREDLIYLFWPDTDDKQARSNLRTLLTRVKARFDYADLTVEREQVRWQVETDLNIFRAALAKKNALKAVKSYTGFLLHNYSCSQAPEFERWLELERAELESLFQDTATKLIEDFTAKQAFVEAAEVSKKVFEQNPFDETNLRRYLSILSLASQVDKALKEYERFKKLLHDEFETEPENETSDLIKTILTASKHTQRSKQLTVKQALKEKSIVSVPKNLTTFVGREDEKARLVDLIQENRLVSIIAPGGMGKTRLSIAVAEKLLEYFKEGVYFIAFADVTDRAGIIHTIADVLKLELQPNQDAEKQVISFLQTKEILFITDNLEHLLNELSFLITLLEEAPNIKILATSREALKFSIECVFDLEGLSFPQGSTSIEMLINDFDATRLFLQRSKKYLKNPELGDDLASDIALICQRLGGMPLAIELASGWLRHLGITELREELEEDFDLLETSNRDVEQRQHSIRNIYEQSLKRLRPKEQESLICLAIFQGGFSREAAKEVTNVSLPVLASLHDKAFFTTSEPGYYKQHPLLWQLIRENLNTKDERNSLEEKHAEFFMNFLAEQPDMQRTLETKKIRKIINRDLANVVEAWLWASQALREDLLLRGSHSFFNIYKFEGRLVEWKRLLQFTSNKLNNESNVHGVILYGLGMAFNLTSNYDEAFKAFERCITIFQSNNNKQQELMAYFHLSLTYGWTNQWDEQRELLEKCRSMALKIGDDFYAAWALRNLANSMMATEKEAAIKESIATLKNVHGYFPIPNALNFLARFLLEYKGKYREALASNQEAIEFTKTNGWQSHVAFSLLLNAEILVALGQFETAKAPAQEAFHLTQDLKYFFGGVVASRALYTLGMIAYLNSNNKQAIDYFQESLLLARQRGDFWYQAIYLSGLAKVNLVTGNFAKAKCFCEEAANLCADGKTQGFHPHDLLFCQAEMALMQQCSDEAYIYLRQALKESGEMRPQQLRLFVSYADLLILQGGKDKAAQLLKCAQDDKASSFETRMLANKKLEAFIADEIPAMKFNDLLKYLE